jgi:hypothetical protein
MRWCLVGWTQIGMSYVGSDRLELARVGSGYVRSRPVALGCIKLGLPESFNSRWVESGRLDQVELARLPLALFGH